MWERIKDLFATLWSLIVAIARLFCLALCFITSGLQVILFTRTEVYNLEMMGQPFRCDKEKLDDQLSFVDKLCISNPDLLGLPDGGLSEEELKALEDFENDNEDEDDNNGL